MRKAWNNKWFKIVDSIEQIPEPLRADFINTCDINRDYFLTVAAATNNARAVRRLLEMKADIHVQNNYGETALSISLEHKYEDVVKCLIDN